jgi:hypothetical protein
MNARRCATTAAASINRAGNEKTRKICWFGDMLQHFGRLNTPISCQKTHTPISAPLDSTGTKLVFFLKLGTER